MSSASDPLRLSWQWNRSPNHALSLVIDRIAPESGGLFGILRSPSLADALPDGQVLEGHVAAADILPLASAVVVRIPKRELPPLATGQHVAIGYTDDAAAVRIAATPAGLSAQAEADWLKAWAAEK
jgi:hypothetical protein